MKLAAMIARYLMGVIFTIFGLNGFLHFIPQPPPTSALALQYLTVMSTSHYLVLAFLIQLIGGVLLLANRFVPLALTLLAPIIVNILLFHALMDPGNIVLGLIVAVCWFLVFASVRRAFDGLFDARAPQAVR